MQGIFTSNLRFLQCYALFSLGLPQTAISACLKPYVKFADLRQLEIFIACQLYSAGWSRRAVKVFIHPQHKYELSVLQHSALGLSLPESNIFVEFRTSPYVGTLFFMKIRNPFSMYQGELTPVTEEEYFEGIFRAIDNNSLLSISRFRSLISEEVPLTDELPKLIEHLKQC